MAKLQEQESNLIVVSATEEYASRHNMKVRYKKDQYNTIGDTKVLSMYFEGEKVYSANKE